MNVLAIDDYRPLFLGIAHCDFCRDNWEFEYPISNIKRIPYFECPTCQGMYGKITLANYVERYEKKIK